MRQDARTWFKDVRKDLDLDFDVYYLCLLAGLATRRKVSVPGSDLTDVIPHFPGAYRPFSKLIIALFLTVELEELGVTGYGERRLLHSAVRELINPQSAHHLTDIGVDTINRYSYGGFDSVTEWFDERPRRAETFLPVFFDRLGTELGGLAPAPFSR